MTSSPEVPKSKSWLKPPRLYYVIVGAPLLAGALGKLGELAGFWTFPV